MSKRSEAFKKYHKIKINSDAYCMKTNNVTDYKWNSNNMQWFKGISQINNSPSICSSKHEFEANDCASRAINDAFMAGEKKERDRHLKAEDDAFERGKRYGAQQRENELRQKYDFIEKNLHKKSNNLKTYSIPLNEDDPQEALKVFFDLFSSGPLKRFFNE